MDQGRCAFCKADLTGKSFQTHHLYYGRLGREHLSDVVTLCVPCHNRFHEQWDKKRYWQTESQKHWDEYDLVLTAKICAEVYTMDKYLGGELNSNLCNADLAKQAVDAYIQTYHIARPFVDIEDIVLFVRNKRWELFFQYEAQGMNVEQFLDAHFGKKERGKNPLRRDAGSCSAWSHKPASMHKHYSENKNMNILMEEAKKYEQANRV